VVSWGEIGKPVVSQQPPPNNNTERQQGMTAPQLLLIGVGLLVGFTGMLVLPVSIFSCVFAGYGFIAASLPFIKLG